MKIASSIKVWALKKIFFKIVGTVHGKIDTPEERHDLAVKLISENLDALIAATEKALEKGDLILDKFDQ